MENIEHTYIINISSSGQDSIAATFSSYIYLKVAA